MKKTRNWDGFKSNTVSKTADKSPHTFKPGDLVKVAHRRVRGTVASVIGETLVEVRFTNGDWDTYEVRDVTRLSNPLAKKLSQIVCHDDPNRTMHLGVTCQLSMTVKEFNALIQRAAKVLNGGRKP